MFSVLLGAAWFGFLSLGSRSPSTRGRGLDEYVLVTTATVKVFSLVAVAALVFSLGVSRAYLLIALVTGLTGLILTRWAWRYAEARERRAGKYRSRILVVGGPRAAVDVATEFAKDPWAGYDVVGICTPSGAGGDTAYDVAGVSVPVVGEDSAILAAVQQNDIQAVALAATDHLRPVEIRRLMWELEGIGVDLLVAPGLVDVADQRLRSRPVSGMAVFEIAKPRYSKANSALKRGVDIVISGLALFALSPIMALAALAVVTTSPGPVFYRSERIGLNGKPFRMTKFRSMVVDADKHADKLLAASGQSTMFFKLKDDPRITPVGAFLRKFSIDELPQLFDVLRGDMSMVGPRPQVRREVDTYDDLVRRRLSVKPGITGLWQVSGRSDIDLADAVRLDLSYVENWSPMLDVFILLKTVVVVLRSDGAY